MSLKAGLKHICLRNIFCHLKHFVKKHLILVFFTNMRWAGHLARMGEERKVYRVLVGKPESKRPLGRPRRRWKNDIRMDLR
jgi:hypothetical protein